MARVCVDSNYFDVDDDGRLTVVRGSLGYQETLQVFGGLISLNFQIADYPLASWIFVECVGGGGGGCGADARATSTTGAVGGGGSGGTYAASWLRASTLPGVVVATAGAGGAGGVFADGDNGNASSFGSLVVAPGGIGAREVYGASTSATRNPGAASPSLGTGQVRKSGQPGENGVMAHALNKSGGNGGASGWNGTGGLGGLANQAGTNGQVYAGGGGGGAAAYNAAMTGGSGGAGIIRIHIFN